LASSHRSTIRASALGPPVTRYRCVPIESFRRPGAPVEQRPNVGNESACGASEERGNDVSGVAVEGHSGPVVPHWLSIWHVPSRLRPGGPERPRPSDVKRPCWDDDRHQPTCLMGCSPPCPGTFGSALLGDSYAPRPRGRTRLRSSIGIDAVLRRVTSETPRLLGRPA
jgi:hypothetical protein